MGFKAAPQSDHLLKLVYQFSIAACISLQPLLTEAVFYRWRQRLTGTAPGSGAGFIAVQAAPIDAARPSRTAQWELRLDLGDGLTLHLARH